VIDLETAEPTLHELTDLANCGHVSVVPGTVDEVLVACGGYSDEGFGDTENERLTAGFVRLRVADDGEVTEEAVWRVDSNESNLFAVRSPMALGTTHVLGVAWGIFGESGDALVVTNLVTGAQTTVETASEAFSLGGPARIGSVVLVPDASSDAPAVWRFSASAGNLTAMDELTVDPALPPRAIVAY